MFWPGQAKSRTVNWGNGRLGALRHPKLRRSSPWIGFDLSLRGSDGLPGLQFQLCRRDIGGGRITAHPTCLASSGLKEPLHDPVLKRVKGHHCKPAPGLECCFSGRKSLKKLAELAIHCDPKGLERSGCGVTLARFLTG